MKYILLTIAILVLMLCTCVEKFSPEQSNDNTPPGIVNITIFKDDKVSTVATPASKLCHNDAEIIISGETIKKCPECPECPKCPPKEPCLVKECTIM